MNEEIYYRWKDRNRTQTPGGGESMTDGSFGNDTDVNKIIARFARTGELPGQLPQDGQFQDVTPFQEDLDTLINKTNHARKELEGIQKQAQAAQALQAKKDAEDLAAYRALQAQTDLQSPGTESQSET